MTAVAAHILDSPGAYRIPSESGHYYYVYREIEITPHGHGDLWGAMKGTVIIAPGVDLTELTGEVWKAESDDWNPSTNT